jgi:pilus assembly protein Flp/PilA
MKALLKKFAREESGATLVEYGVALLVVIIVGTGGLIALANRTNTNFTSATTAATPP